MSLEAFVRSHPGLLVISGAGCSTASGIPDYRDRAGRWKRPQPIGFDAFCGSELERRRYWARSMLGWPAFARAQPNLAHHGLAWLAERDFIAALVTQNVDGLHQRAGHHGVIDLHGRLDQVVCLDCGVLAARADVQDWLARHNPELCAEALGGAGSAPAGSVEAGSAASKAAADGHSLFEPPDVSTVAIPACQACGGLLKPNVVFYGESVPRARVASVYSALSRCSGVLVVGSSVKVFSSFRFCRAAQQAGKPVVAINQGDTRADAFLQFKVDADCGAAIEGLTRALS